MNEKQLPKIRVCLIHNQITPYRLPLFEELNKNVELTVLFCQSRSKDRLWHSDLENYSFHYRVLGGFNLGPFIINYSIIPVLVRKDVDVYIIGENFENIFSTFFCCFLSKLKKKPFLIWTEAIDTHFLIMRNEERLKRKYIQTFYDSTCICYRRFLYKLTDGFIAYSQKARKYLIQNGVKPEKISCGGQVIPIDRILLPDALEQKQPITKKKKIILSIGYLRFEKGIDILIKAFKKTGRDDSVLVIGGSGPELKRLKELSENDTNIQFLGYLSETKKSYYFSIADIFVLPTFHDPWGLTVNEAMSYGLPIIITHAAGCIDYLIEGNGIIVNPGNIDELQKALQYLLDDKEIREKMGEKSREILLRFDLKTGVKPFIDAISYVTQAE
jgi:glycosyltransferase involved in cell wall biosynthesis